MNRTALTLLEILLATTLLAFVTIALGTWLRVVGRASAQSAHLVDQERAWSAMVRLLKADINGCVSAITIGAEGRSIRFATINHLPGETELRRLTLWTCNPQGLNRETESVNIRETPQSSESTQTPKPPLTLTSLPPPTRFRKDDQGIIWLDFAAEIFASTTPVTASKKPEVATPSIPLWREWH